jgi:mRNA interferase MazF
VAQYTPAQGEYIAVNFEPQAGHEQKGRRPALVISKTAFNQRHGLAIVCPITNTARNLPFRVPVGDVGGVTGYVMVDQTKSLDFRARRATHIGFASPDVLDEVLAVLDACLY